MRLHDHVFFVRRFSVRGGTNIVQATVSGEGDDAMVTLNYDNGRHRDGAGRHGGLGAARLFARGEEHLRHLARHDDTLDGRDDASV